MFRINPFRKKKTIELPLSIIYCQPEGCCGELLSNKDSMDTTLSKENGGSFIGNHGVLVSIENFTYSNYVNGSYVSRKLNYEEFERRGKPRSIEVEVRQMPKPAVLVDVID